MTFFCSDFQRLLWGALLLALSFPVLAQIEGDAAPDLSDLWIQQMETFRKGSENPDCEESFLVIREFLLENGVSRAPEISAAYVQLGMKSLEEGRYSDAQWAFGAALKLDQFNVTASRAALSNGWRLGFAEGFSRLSERINIGFGRLLSIGIRHLVWGNLALALSLSLMLLGLTTIGVVGIRQSALVISEMQHRIRFIKDLRILGIVWLVLLASIFLSPGGLVSLIVVVQLVSFAFSEKKYRYVLWLAWLLILGSFALTLGHLFPLMLEESTFFRSACYSLYGGYSEPLVAELKQLVGEETDPVRRARIQFMLGMMYKKGGFFNDARRELEHYIEVNPRDADVYINLGNIEFINDRIKTAIEMYRKAESLDAQNPRIYLNLSKAYLSQFRFDEAREMQNKAMRLDPELTAELIANHSSKPVRMVSDVPVSHVWLVDETKRTLRSAAAGIEDYWKSPLVRIGFTPGLIGWGCVALLMMILPFIARSLVLSRYCLKCRKPMKPDLKSGGTDHICVTCHMVFFKKTETGKSRPGVAETFQPVHLNRDLVIHRVLSILIPGAGRLYSGYVLSSLIMMAVWSGSIGAILASEHFIPTYLGVPAGIQGLDRTILMALIVLDYAVSIRWGLREINT